MPASRRLTALLLCITAGCDSPPTSETRSPAAIEAVSGAVQEGAVGAELPEPLVVRVTDARGRAVAGVSVQFVVTAGGGSVVAGQALTDAEGEARDRWTLGTVAGDTQRVEARLVSITPPPAAAFRAVGTAAAPGAPQAVGARQRGGPAGAALADPLAVKVTDAFGNPVAGVAVAWQVVAGGGTVTPAGAATGADGVAAAQWSLGPVVGAGQQVRATSAQGTVDFGATATLPADVVLQAESGSGQTGTAGTALAAPLVARVLLADGRPLQGAPVAWTPAAGTVSPVDGMTDAAGRASAQWTLPQQAGAVLLTASVPSTAAAATFAASAAAGAPASLQAVGSVQFTGPAGEPLTQHPAVRVLDAYGNPVPGVAVSWEVVSGGGSVTGGAGGGDGTATVQWWLGPVLGAGHQLRATAAGGTVDFSATATFPGGVVLQAESGSGQTGPVGTLLPEPLVARVLLADGRALQGAEVRWVAGSGEGTLILVEGVTGSTGRASARWGLPGQAQALAVDATLVASGGTVAFTATAVPGPPARVDGVPIPSLTITAGDVLNLQARVLDAYGNAVPGVAVSWEPEAGAPAGSPPSSVTDASGTAATQWAPNRRGYHRMNARTAAVADTATWRVFVVPGPITQIVFSPRTLTLAGPGLSDEFIVYTADQYGNRNLSGTSGYVLHVSSSDTAVATVNPEGSDFDGGWRVNVTPTGPGTAVIHASITELQLSGSGPVQVEP